MNTDPPNGAQPRIVTRRVAVVILGYLAYGALAASLPIRTPPIDASSTGPLVDLGRAAWRANNCQSCHSIYGLGGHTGPDVTNAFSRVGDGYIRQVLRMGVRAMPVLDLSESEIDALVAYLDDMDRSGTYPPPGLGEPVFGVPR